MEPHISNTHELRCIALHRSGHHAILNWIMANLDGRYCFINDCRTSSNPFREASRSGNLERKLSTNIEDFNLEQESIGVHCQKDYLLYNYEEKDILDLDTEVFRANHDLWLGRSQTFHNLLVLRDPFNTIASKLVMEDNRQSFRTLPDTIRQLSAPALLRIVGRPRRLLGKVAKRLRAENVKRERAGDTAGRSKERFKEYAREYLGDTNHLSRKVLISYNRWFVDPDYRSDLAKVLCLSSADRGLDRVAKWGSGSSFNQKTFDGRAGDMNVLERWKTVRNDPRFRAAIDDPELHALSERIFGPVMQG